MPDRLSAKRALSQSNRTPGTPTPSMPAPSTPGVENQELNGGPNKKAKKAKTVEPLTPLAKGRDMAQKLLKKKGDADKLALTLKAVPYAQQLADDMVKYVQSFELFGLQYEIMLNSVAWHGKDM